MEEYYVAEYSGPPLRRLHIHEDKNGPYKEASNYRSGWEFVVEEANEKGEMQPLWDTWEEHYYEIIRYPEDYAPKGVIWKRNGTEEVVDIYNNPYVKEGK